MLIVYEKLEDFLEELKKEAVIDKTRSIFLSILRPLDEQTNIMSAQIYIQLLKDGNALTFQYTDLPEIKILSPMVFDSVFSGEEAEKAKKNYELKNTGVNNKLLEEYNKIQNILKEIGFTDFKKAVIQ